MTDPGSRAGTADVILSVENVSVSFGGLRALSDVSLQVRSGQRIGLIGPNGAGKSTLLNIITGFIRPDAGVVRFHGQDITNARPEQRARLGLARSFQTPRLMEADTVALNVSLGCERLRQPSVLNQIIGLGRSLRLHRRDDRLTDEAMAAMEIAELDHEFVHELPFASRRVTELGRTLVEGADVVLLDEPAAGLTYQDRQSLTVRLKRRESASRTFVIVEHDMQFLEGLCDHVVALNFGTKIAEGAPTDVLSDPEVQAAYFGHQAR